MKPPEVKAKILIVDDEPKNLKILRLHLEEQFELREASSGEEALKILESYDPAIILLDIMMPEMDGYQVTKKIRMNPKLKSIKIILLSGRAMVEDKLQGYRCGANDYLTKPFDGEELKAKLNTFAEIYDLERKLREMNASLEKEVLLRTEQLLAAERLAFIGRHSCEIVHNLKNPLTILKLYLSQVEKENPEDPRIKKMSTATNRILDFVKDILSANTKLDLKSEEININEVVREEVQFLKVAATSRYPIKQNLNLNCANLIMASNSHMHQIIGNLIKNAVESMHGMSKGEISIDTADIATGVKLSISDTGSGISEEAMSQLFTPLFTTKKGEAGGPVGNGLGLPYCKKMIESYGGAIEISSQVGKGTTVSIQLPKMAQAA